MNRRLFLSALPLMALASAVVAQTLPAGPERDPDVPFVPTRLEVVEAMLQIAEVKPEDVVYDLGCGDGRIPIAAAQKFGARGVGIDIEPALIAEAYGNASIAGVNDRTRFIVGDLFKADISEATVVTLYLLPGINEKLKPKLIKELKPGTRIVSHDFGIGDWAPERTVKLGSDIIYLWRIPG